MVYDININIDSYYHQPVFCYFLQHNQKIHEFQQKESCHLGTLAGLETAQKNGVIMKNLILWFLIVVVLPLFLEISMASATGSKKILLKVPIAHNKNLIGIGTTIDYVAKRVKIVSEGKNRVRGGNYSPRLPTEPCVRVRTRLLMLP